MTVPYGYDWDRFSRFTTLLTTIDYTVKFKASGASDFTHSAKISTVITKVDSVTATAVAQIDATNGVINELVIDAPVWTTEPTSVAISV